MMTRNQLIHTSAIKYICSPSHLRPCKQWKEQPIERNRNGENKTARRETTTYTHAHTLIQRENRFNRKISEGNQNTPYLTQFWILHTITHTHTHRPHHISGELYCLPIYLLNTKIRNVLDRSRFDWRQLAISFYVNFRQKNSTIENCRCNKNYAQPITPSKPYNRRRTIFFVSSMQKFDFVSLSRSLHVRGHVNVLDGMVAVRCGFSFVSCFSKSN